MKIHVQHKLDKINKLGKLEYDPKCKYCMNNIFVKDAIQTRKEVENDADYVKELNAGPKSVTVIIESHDHFTSSATLKDVLKAADSEHVGLLWDAHHTFVNGRERIVRT